MTVTRTLLQATLAGSLVLCGFGCGGGAKPRTVPVEGKVTLEGAPLEGAMVQFQPIGTGHVANGVSGKDGSFRLTTFSTGDGAMPGNYQIVVLKRTDPQADPTAMDPTKMSGSYVDMMKGTAFKPGSKPRPPQEVHDNYQKPGDKNPLKQVIDEGGNRNVVIPLRKDGT